MCRNGFSCDNPDRQKRSRNVPRLSPACSPALGLENDPTVDTRDEHGLFRPS